ncbi:MAG TPA: hypothetical protein VE988_02340 [Gemmataceae bacterium]|nr:hypothetical protein [Gemmataceae bacterium]
MKKFMFAAFGVLALVGFVVADEFNANITKVDGNTVYYKKAGGKKGAPATEDKADVTSDVKILKGEAEFIPDPAPAKKGAAKKGAAKKGAAKKGGAGGTTEIKAGDPLPGGLKNDLFTKIDPDSKGIQSKIITNDAGKIVEIRAVAPPP